MMYETGIPKQYDYYTMVKIEMIDTDVRVTIRSVTTGRRFVETHKMGKYSKKLVSNIIHAFFGIKRIEWTNYFFNQLNYVGTNKQVCMHMKVVLGGYERSKVKNVIRHTDENEWLRDRLQLGFSSDMEFRQFVQVDTPKEVVVPEVQRVTCLETKSPIILATCQIRCGDTLYFCTYNTMTGKQFCSTDCEKIKSYLDTVEGRFVMDRPDYYNMIDTFGDREVTVLQSLLNSQKVYSVIQHECLDIMQLNISGSEPLQAIQYLEALKYLFETKLSEVLRANILIGKMVESAGLEPSSSVGVNASLLFGRDVKPTFSFDTYKEKLYAGVRNDIRDFLEGKSKALNLWGVDLSIGESGLGGLKGCIPGYAPPAGREIIHLDFSSFYPTIILLYYTMLGETIDKEAYKRVYEKKFNSSGYTREAYKLLINSVSGMMGKRDGNSTLHNRDAYKCVVKIGQVLMLDFLHYLLRNPNLKLVHVNCDGCYVEAPEGQEVEFEYDMVRLDGDTFVQMGRKFPIKVTRFENMYISGIYDYMLLGYGGEVTCKGKFKHVEGRFVKNLLINKYLYGVQFEDGEYEVEDLIYYDSKMKCRRICYQGTYENFKIDTYGLHYMEGRDVKPNLEHYYSLAREY